MNDILACPLIFQPWFFLLNAAIYMGFKQIFLLGLDFPPGAFSHFTDLGEDSKCDDPTSKSNKGEVCGNYWSYSKAHFESYALV